jgi:hypothetical protein
VNHWRFDADALTNVDDNDDDDDNGSGDYDDEYHQRNESEGLDWSAVAHRRGSKSHDDNDEANKVWDYPI